MFVLFTFLSGIGIFPWSAYQFLIFKDPFYWMKVYMGKTNIISLEYENRQHIEGFNEKIILPLHIAFIKYFNVVAQINGILFVYIIIILAICSFIYKKIKFQSEDKFACFIISS